MDSDTSQVGKGVKRSKWILRGLLLIALAKVCAHVWVLNKGVDIWDESWYIIILNFYKLYPTEPHSYYGYVLNKLLPISYNIISLRVLGLLSELIGAIFFTSCFMTWFRKQGFRFNFNIQPYFILLLVIVAGTFTSVYTRAFSYNDMSYFLMLVSIGTSFLILQDPVPFSIRKKTLATAGFLFIGVLVGLLLIVKFSTSLLTAGWIALFMIVQIQNNWKYKTILLAALITGVTSFIWLFFGDIEHIATWLQNMQHGINMLRLLSYDTYGIFIQGYIKVDLIENGIYYAIPLLVSFIAHTFLISKKTYSKTTVLLLAYLIGILTWLFTSLTIKHYFLGEFFNRFIAVHIYTLLFWCIPFTKQLIKRKQWRSLLYLLLALVLPYIALMGSNNPTTETLTKYLVPWYIVIAILLLHNTAHSKPALRCFVMVMIVYSSLNYLWVQMLNPYGMRTTVFQQTETVDGLSYFSGLKFDKASANFFRELRNTTESTGYKVGNPILALGDLCGAVIAMGGYMPQTFWYFSDANATSPQHARAFNCYHLNELKVAEYPALPLIMINSGMHNDVIDCLKESEIPFPELYHLVNTIENPYAQEKLSIWAPNKWQLQ